MGLLRVGRQREQPQSKILSADKQRQKRTERRRRPMAKNDARNRPHPWGIVRISRRETQMSCRRFTGRTRKDQDFAEEIESHLAHEEDANLARGFSPEEARRQAHLRFGNPRTVREKEWRYRSIAWIEDLRRDFSFAVRALRKSPGFPGHRGSRDRRRDRRKYGSFLRNRCGPAQAPHLSKSRGIGRADAIQARRGHSR